MSNFIFLQSEWPELYAEAASAERYAAADPRTSCFYARRALELAVAWLFRADATLRRPYRDDLSAYLFDPGFQALVGQAVHAKMDLIRRDGNAAVHRARIVREQDAQGVVRDLFHVMYWLARHYARTAGGRPDLALRFDPTLVPASSANAAAKTQAQVKALEAELAARDEKLADEQRRNDALNAELAQLRAAQLQAEVAAAKALNLAVSDTHDYDEATTRDRFIDRLLRDAGWPLNGASDTEYAVTGMPTPSGTGYVDYVLWGDDGKPLAIVEAKRTRRDARAGQQQAKLYADCLETMTGQRPVIYYTNGYEHWLWDDQTYPPRAVQGFHHKDELERLIQRRTTRQPLATAAINTAIVERHYQHRAIRRIAETFEQDKQRKALVVMATGAGKTRTVIALVDMLMRYNWVKRVLFLADRVALVKQAADAFAAHLPDAALVNLVRDKTLDGRVYVSTYPTMMGLIDGRMDGVQRFGPGHFDLVIVDEAHRSIYQKYRAIFSYFDALLVGLTATPKDEIDRNTYGMFGLEDGVPTDAYGLDEAIAERYLVPPRAVSVPLQFQRDGIRYDNLSEDEKDQWDALEWDEDSGAPDIVEAEAVNKWLFNEDTADKMIALLMEERGHRVAGGDWIGKTIIFAKNNDHAKFIADRFDSNYPQYAGQLARVITYEVEQAQTLIDDFSVVDKMPRIAISVDMLDTGIDVPEVVNLVFFKIVRSKAKFWQMVGRGTRLCKDLYGPGQDKQDFLIFDFCQNFEFFNANPDAAEGAMQAPLGQRLFNARLELLASLDAQPRPLQAEEPRAGYGGPLTDWALREETATWLHRQVASMSFDNFVVRANRRYVEPYAKKEAWQRLRRAQAAELAQHVSGLPTALRDDNDEAAKRFDLLMLRLQLCVLHDEPGLDRMKTQVRDLAEALLSKDTARIPAVQDQIDWIEAVAGEAWWEDVSLPMLEQTRRRLRSLIHLIEVGRRRKPLYTDFADALGEVTEIAMPAFAGGTDFERFRAKARVFLRAHEDHLTLHKLRRNLPLTQADLIALEHMLSTNSIGAEEDIERAKREANGLGLFVRSLIGLDRQAAMEALSDFVAGKTMNANQLEFVDLIVKHLTEHGLMEASRLYTSPFTDITPHGPDGLFGPAEVDALVAALHQVKARAIAA